MRSCLDKIVCLYILFDNLKDIVHNPNSNIMFVLSFYRQLNLNMFDEIESY